MPGEFMHEFEGHFQNLMDEMPMHLDALASSKLSQFLDKCREDKQQLKACDTRRYAVQLAAICSSFFKDKKISKDDILSVQIMMEISEKPSRFHIKSLNYPQAT